jgi:hypothetical protein
MKYIYCGVQRCRDRMKALWSAETIKYIVVCRDVETSVRHCGVHGGRINYTTHLVECRDRIKYIFGVL